MNESSEDQQKLGLVRTKENLDIMEPCAKIDAKRECWGPTPDVLVGIRKLQKEPEI